MIDWMIIDFICYSLKFTIETIYIMEVNRTFSYKIIKNVFTTNIEIMNSLLLIPNIHSYKAFVAMECYLFLLTQIANLNFPSVFFYRRQ